MASKEELKTIFVTGAVPTEADFHNLIDVAGEKGAKGDKGEPGAAGADGAKGAKGDKGDAGAPGADGKDGAQGPKGDPGADGFGTEAQYNDIIARLEALEAPAE